MQSALTQAENGLAARFTLLEGQASGSKSRPRAPVQLPDLGFADRPHTPLLRPGLRLPRCPCCCCAARCLQPVVPLSCFLSMAAGGNQVCLQSNHWSVGGLMGRCGRGRVVEAIKRLQQACHTPASTQRSTSPGNQACKQSGTRVQAAFPLREHPHPLPCQPTCH